MTDGGKPHKDQSDPTGAVPVGSDDADTTLTFDYPALRSPKVAIVGFAAGTAHKAPFSDPDVETWGINQLWKILPERRWDRWFELHSLYDFYHANPAHQQFLRDFTGPVYVREQDYALALEWGIDTAQPFPHRVILEHFRPYFTNTISWLLALAITMGPEWMGIYGVDMAQDSILAAEYSEQRPSCEYFIGLAEASGIEVSIPNGADLLGATHLYGYEDSGRTLEKMTGRFGELANNQEQLRQQAAQIETQLQSIRGTIAQMEGAKQEINYWRKNWLTPPPSEIQE